MRADPRLYPGVMGQPGTELPHASWGPSCGGRATASRFALRGALSSQRLPGGHNIGTFESNMLRAGWSTSCRMYMGWFTKGLGRGLDGERVKSLCRKARPLHLGEQSINADLQTAFFLKKYCFQKKKL